ncbi:MAG: phosphate ABC transporter permease PstA [Bacteroidales bacterium]|nr:phosphate ABC transporter permease PstA [Candidatus Scybalousia scybalohippi]
MNNTINNTRRLVTSRGIHLLVCSLSIITSIPLVFIIGKVFFEGIHNLNLQFITKPTPNTFNAMIAINNGENIPGGIANGIVGSFIMLILASIIAIPIGILCGTYLAENRHNKFAKCISYMTDLLQGTPSIIIGIVVYAWVVIPSHGYSAIAGSIALAVMMLPLIVRSTEEALKMLPDSLKESSLALGGSYGKTILKVLLPSASGSIFTGVLLAVSRVVGETAPITFTALGCSMVHWNIDQPMSSIPLLIWQFYNDPILQPLVWSASLFLLIFVLFINISAKIINNKSKK